MIGKAVSKIANTFNNIVMGVATSKTTEKVVGGVFRGLGKTVEPAAGVANKTLEGIQSVGKAAMDANTYSRIGKSIEATAGKAVRNVITNPDSYKQIGNTHTVVANKSLFGDEMKRRMQSSLDTVAHISRGDSLLTLKQPLLKTGGDNLLPAGVSATGLGVGLAAASQLAIGTPQAVEQWNRNRQGTNFDNQPVTSTPRMPAYANNGGATGDLVFALNNLRHGGMM